MSEGRFLSFDAAETLTRFMADGSPDPRLFAEVVGNLIAQLASTESGETRRVVVFGETVALLWADGQFEAAIRLEQLWNELARTHSFQLHCVSAESVFPGAGWRENPGNLRGARACRSGGTVYDPGRRSGALPGRLPKRTSCSRRWKARALSRDRTGFPRDISSTRQWSSRSRASKEKGRGYNSRPALHLCPPDGGSLTHEASCQEISSDEDPSPPPVPQASVPNKLIAPSTTTQNPAQVCVEESYRPFSLGRFSRRWDLQRQP
jgi:hypothetical protein